MVSHRPRHHHSRLNISSRVQQRPPHPGCRALPTRALLHQVLHRGISPYGIPFAVVKLIDPAGRIHRALACQRRFGDLHRLQDLEGQEVNLLRTHKGLQLLPPHDLPGATETAASLIHGRSEDRATTSVALEELVNAVAVVAKKLNLPTAIWVHLP